MSKIRANFISSKNDNRAVEFTSGIVVGGAVTATNFDFNADTYNGEVYNVGTGASIYQESSNQLKFGIGNQEAVSIRGDESVDIGGTPPWTTTGSGYRNLSISGSTQSSSAFVWLGNGAATQNNGFDLARINIMNGPTIVSQIKGSTGDGNNDSGKITFITKATGSSLAEAATFTTAGNLAFPSGQGIDFSATSDSSGTMTSELLDDYEEGTFTPNLLLYSSGSILETISPLSSSFKGRYTKIGHRVWVEIYSRYNISTITSSAWTQTLIELPFAQGSFGGQQYAPAFVGYYASFITAPTSSDANHYFPGAYVGSSTNRLYLTINQMNAAETYIDETNISSNASAGVMVSANYCTESI